MRVIYFLSTAFFPSIVDVSNRDSRSRLREAGWCPNPMSDPYAKLTLTSKDYDDLYESEKHCF